MQRLWFVPTWFTDRHKDRQLLTSYTTSSANCTKNALVLDKYVHNENCMLNPVHHNPNPSRHRPYKPFAFFSSQCRFWTFVSCSTRHIAALFEWCIPIFQDVSDAIIKTFQLISHAGSVWVAAEWLWHLYRRSRRRRQILRYSCLATNWCPQNFLNTSRTSTSTHACHQTNNSIYFTYHILQL